MRRNFHPLIPGGVDEDNFRHTPSFPPLFRAVAVNKETSNGSARERSVAAVGFRDKYTQQRGCWRHFPPGITQSATRREIMDSACSLFTWLKYCLLFYVRQKVPARHTCT